MKITFKLSKEEAFQLAATLHRAGRRSRLEALYPFAQDSIAAATLLAQAKLYQRLSSEILERSL